MHRRRRNLLVRSTSVAWRLARLQAVAQVGPKSWIESLSPSITRLCDRHLEGTRAAILGCVANRLAGSRALTIMPAGTGARRLRQQPPTLSEARSSAYHARSWRRGTVQDLRQPCRTRGFVQAVR